MIITWPVRHVVFFTSLPAQFLIYLHLPPTHYTQGIFNIPVPVGTHFCINFIFPTRSDTILINIGFLDTCVPLVIFPNLITLPLED